MSDATFASAELIADLAGQDRLAEANLVMADLARGPVDSTPVLERLDRLAAAVDGTTHLAIRRVISIAEGIGGNVDDYHDEGNHFLDSVLASRRGIPISLSTVWIEVGRRAGIEMEGVGMPGHFLVYAGGQLVDPFHYGEAIGFDEAARLVADALGGEPRADRTWFRPISGPAMVRRMLINLERLYVDEGDARNLEWVSACLGALPTI